MPTIISSLQSLKGGEGAGRVGERIEKIESELGSREAHVRVRDKQDGRGDEEDKGNLIILSYRISCEYFFIF